MRSSVSPDDLTRLRTSIDYFVHGALKESFFLGLWGVRSKPYPRPMVVLCVNEALREWAPVSTSRGV